MPPPAPSALQCNIDPVTSQGKSITAAALMKAANVSRQGLRLIRDLVTFLCNEGNDLTEKLTFSQRKDTTLFLGQSGMR